MAANRVAGPPVQRGCFWSAVGRYRGHGPLLQFIAAMGRSCNSLRLKAIKKVRCRPRVLRERSLLSHPVCQFLGTRCILRRCGLLSDQFVQFYHQFILLS